MTKHRLQEIKDNIARLEISGEVHVSYIGLDTSDVVAFITALQDAWQKHEDLEVEILGLRHRIATFNQIPRERVFKEKLYL